MVQYMGPGARLRGIRERARDGRASHDERGGASIEYGSDDHSEREGEMGIRRIETAWRPGRVV